MLTSQRSDWTECCQHEEEIAILQEKLIEVHNKLIDQLDVCKEQELTIIQLSNRLHNSQTTPVFNYQSFGQHPQDQENRAPNQSNCSHDSRTSHQAKTELLQADLEAMRSKVLGEITEKNRLKEETRELKSRHRREMGQQLKKNQELLGINQQLKEEFDELRAKYERSRRSQKNQSEVDKLAQLLTEAESKYIREKESNKELQRKLVSLQQSQGQKVKRLPQMEERANWLKSSEPKLWGESDKKSAANSNKSEGGCRTEEKLRRHNFDETRDLIKKLEQTEILMRKNRRPVT